MLSLPEIAGQLRLEEDDIDEKLKVHLISLCAAATETVSAELCRKLYASKEDMDADESAPRFSMVVNEPIKLAIKLLIGHFYANREATTEDNLKVIPLGVQYLLDPFRMVEI